MASGAPPMGGGGGPAGGGSQPDLTESVFSSVAKHIGSGLGKLAENALTLGGAHAFEEGRKKDQETQSALMDSMKDRASRGETFTTDDYRAWQNANGDPAVVAGLQRDAMGINKQREESRGYLETLHKGGILNDQQYAMWAMALHSNDPTATALAMEGIKSQAQLAGIQARVAGAQAITTQREEGQNKREASREGSQQKIASQREGGANAREASREKTALRIKAIGEYGKKNGLDAAKMKNFSDVTSTVAAASGDPAAMKKLLGPEAESMSDDQTKAAFAKVNQDLAGTKGVSFERMVGQGAFMLTGTDGGWRTSGEKRAVGVGLPALVEDASKNQTAGITPEIAAQFRTQWAAALKEKDPSKRAAALDAAIATIPDPNAQQEIYAQLQDMNEGIGAAQGAADTESEGDPAMGLLMGGDTEAGGDGTDN